MCIQPTWLVLPLVDMVMSHCVVEKERNASPSWSTRQSASQGLCSRESSERCIFMTKPVDSYSYFDELISDKHLHKNIAGIPLPTKLHKNMGNKLFFSAFLKEKCGNILMSSDTLWWWWWWWYSCQLASYNYETTEYISTKLGIGCLKRKLLGELNFVPHLPNLYAAQIALIQQLSR
jgi:hypothetical protein